MISEPLYLLKVVLIGLSVGLISGGFGIGGGILASPLMRMFLGISPHVAIGTSLAMIIPTAVFGSISYLRNNLVSRQLAKDCSLWAIVGSIVGSISTLFVSGSFLMLVVALLLFVTGLDFVTGFGKRFRTEHVFKPGERAVNESKALRPAVLVGLCCGFLSGLLGVGGGFLLIPAFLYLFNTSMKVAFGTSLLVVAAVSIPGTIVHAFEHHVNVFLAFVMILGSIPGAWLGSNLAMRMKEGWLKSSFGIILIVLSLTFGCKEVQEMLKLKV